ncbi:MAG: transposase [Leptospiraceae bacterium]|nr:transposase [Leptospiraceae bacterium]MCP5493225.1 transposase [Leptospiraceae bacterium]
MTLEHEEYIRRFLQHVVPSGFMRIRYYGILANPRRKKLLPVCQILTRINH